MIGNIMDFQNIFTRKKVILGLSVYIGVIEIFAKHVKVIVSGVFVGRDLYIWRYLWHQKDIVDDVNFINTWHWENLAI